MRTYQKIALALVVVLSMSGLFAGTVSTTVPALWSRARVLRGAFGIAESGQTAGYCELKCGKASRRGCAKVSLKLVPLQGPVKVFPAKTVEPFEGDGESCTVEWSTYAVTIHRDGTFFGYPTSDKFLLAGSPVREIWSAAVGGPFEGNHLLGFPQWNAQRGWSEDSFNPPSGSEAELLNNMKLFRKYKAVVCTSPGMDLSSVPFVAGGTAWIFLPGDNDWSFRLRYAPQTGLFSGTVRTVIGPHCQCMDADAAARLPRKVVTLKVSGLNVDGQLYGTAQYKSFRTVVRGW